MQNIVIDKPYVPVLPHRGRIWPRILSYYLPRLLRKKYGVTKVEIVNGEQLKQSIATGHGILLTPNHCRDEDPLVIGMLARAVGSPFFVMASWHAFMNDRLQAFLLRRAGAFSIYREGIDRGALNTAIEMLETAERPLLLFPEGIISRTNDQINDLLDGTALIARSAAKKRAKLSPPGKVVVHPIAIRYRFQGDADKAVAAVLEEIEARLTWRRQQDLPPLDRIYKVGTALLTLRELEYLGQPQPGDIAQRLPNLINAVLNPLEDEWTNARHDDTVQARVKRLRTAILPDMTKNEIDEPERARRWRQLADVYLAQQLFHYPPGYARSNPTPERLLETVERFEEDLTDRIRVHGSMHASITVGEAIEVTTTREERGSHDPLMHQIEGQLKAMLGLEGA
jgi:1-acyl-sn-glycerol-3-phosphate acyltransferase